MKGMLILEFSMTTPIFIFSRLLKDFRHLDQSKFKEGLAKMKLFRACMTFVRRVNLHTITFFEWTLLRIQKLNARAKKKTEAIYDFLNDYSFGRKEKDARKRTLRDKEFEIPLPRQYNFNNFDRFIRRNMLRFMENGFIVFESGQAARDNRRANDHRGRDGAHRGPVPEVPGQAQEGREVPRQRVPQQVLRKRNQENILQTAEGLLRREADQARLVGVPNREGAREVPPRLQNGLANLPKGLRHQLRLLRPLRPDFVLLQCEGLPRAGEVLPQVPQRGQRGVRHDRQAQPGTADQPAGHVSEQRGHLLRLRGQHGVDDLPGHRVHGAEREHDPEVLLLPGQRRPGCREGEAAVPDDK